MRFHSVMSSFCTLQLPPSMIVADRSQLVAELISTNRLVNPTLYL